MRSYVSVMDDVPPENILPMVDAVDEFGHYPLGNIIQTVTLYFSGIGSNESAFTLTWMGGKDLPQISFT